MYLRCIGAGCDAVRALGSVVCEDHICTECAEKSVHTRMYYARYRNSEGTYCLVYPHIYEQIMNFRARHVAAQWHSCLGKYRLCGGADDCVELVYDCDYCKHCTTDKLCRYCGERAVDTNLRVCNDHIQFIDCIYPLCTEKVPMTKSPLNGTAEPCQNHPLCSEHSGVVYYCSGHPGCGMMLIDRPCPYCTLKYYRTSARTTYPLAYIISALSKIHRQILFSRCRAIAAKYGREVGAAALKTAVESRATSSGQIMSALNAACDCDLAPIKKWMDKITVDRLISGLEGHQLVVTTHRLSFPEPAGMDEETRFAQMLAGVTEGVPYFRDEVYGIPYQRENHYLLIYYLLWWKLPVDIFEKIMSYV